MHAHARDGSHRPRILYLTPYFPHRNTCAAELRSLHIARALREFGDVEMVVVGGEEKDDEWAHQDEHEFKVAAIEAVSRHPNDTVLKKVSWILNPRRDYPHGWGVDRAAVERVQRMGGSFDLIWFCKLRTSNMFPHWAWDRSVADVDDVPSTFERSALNTASRPGERFRAARLYHSWLRRDRLLGERFTVLGVCSETDRNYLYSLGVRAPLHVIPNGFERPTKESIRCVASPPRIGFVGIFDYKPNLEGIQWFVKECWPIVKRKVPDVRLRLMGRFSDGELKPDGESIDGLGFVNDAGAEIATWSAMVVPLRLGAGTRGKIAQAFSLKCPVISTSLGAYGYEPENGREMSLADTAESFAEACIRAIRQPEEAKEMADRAWHRFLEKWTWESIRPRVWAAAEDCLRRNRC